MNKLYLLFFMRIFANCDANEKDLTAGRTNRGEESEKWEWERGNSRLMERIGYPVFDITALKPPPKSLTFSEEDGTEEEALRRSWSAL